ncbi:hypothetical protein [Amycolatopsis samaneae]|uniref:Uncharacterized protein n=1 Tax=Amycolatopsis samaneae TaxID=664691 RepID=A0ABW5GB27_9PSEU
MLYRGFELRSQRADLDQESRILRAQRAEFGLHGGEFGQDIAGVGGAVLQQRLIAGVQGGQRLLVAGGARGADRAAGGQEPGQQAGGGSEDGGQCGEPVRSQ